MFLSFRYPGLAYPSISENTKKLRYMAIIVDSDFTECLSVEIASGTPSGGILAVILAAIQCYSKRDYTPNQIAKNLFLVFEYIVVIWKHPTAELVKWCLQYLPEFLPYHDDIKMLLLFS